MRAVYNSGLVNAYNLRHNLGQGDEVATNDVELYSAAFTTTSVRYTKQAVLEVETSADVKEIVLVNEKGSVMTAATTVETAENSEINTGSDFYEIYNRFRHWRYKMRRNGWLGRGQ